MILALSCMAYLVVGLSIALHEVIQYFYIYSKEEKAFQDKLDRNEGGLAISDLSFVELIVAYVLVTLVWPLLL